MTVRSKTLTKGFLRGFNDGVGDGWFGGIAMVECDEGMHWKGSSVEAIHSGLDDKSQWTFPFRFSKKKLLFYSSIQI